MMQGMIKIINSIHQSEYELYICFSISTMSTSKTREYFPEIEPFQSGLLKVSDIHQIYYEQSGKQDGKPVVFV